MTSRATAAESQYVKWAAFEGKDVEPWPRGSMARILSVEESSGSSNWGVKRAVVMHIEFRQTRVGFEGSSLLLERR